MKQRRSAPLAVLLALGILLTTMTYATAQVSDSETLTIRARVVNVLRLSISVPNTTTVASASFTFGSQLSVNGQHAAQSSCPAFGGGARYLSPDVVVTVQTNLTYDIRRTHWGNFTPNRLFVRENASFPGACADLMYAALLPKPLTLITSAYGLSPTYARQYTEYFVFDVLPGDPLGTFTGGISYQAQVHV